MCLQLFQGKIACQCERNFEVKVLLVDQQMWQAFEGGDLQGDAQVKPDRITAQAHARCSS